MSHQTPPVNHLLHHHVMSLYYDKQNKHSSLHQQALLTMLTTSNQWTLLGGQMRVRCSYEGHMKVRCLYEGQVLVFVQPIGEFVLLKQVSQTLQVNLMKTLDVLTAGTRSLDH